MSIKISKRSYFPPRFKLNEKIVPLKIWFGEGGYKKIFAGGMGLIFSREVGNISKKGVLDKKGV